jgi:hypothetical protein
MLGQVLSWPGQIVWVRGMVRRPRPTTAALRDVPGQAGVCQLQQAQDSAA